MQAAAARRLQMDPMDQMDQMDKIGAPLNNPWVCGAAVWIGSGADLPQCGLARAQICRRVCGQLDGCGGMRVAVARRLPMDPMDQMDQMDKIGAPLNNPWVCGAAVWNGSGAD